jgi:hypothetical protein
MRTSEEIEWEIKRKKTRQVPVVSHNRKRQTTSPVGIFATQLCASSSGVLESSGTLDPNQQNGHSFQH